MDNKLEQELLQWSDDILAFHLPRWSELPEIDLYMDQVIVFSERIFSRFPGTHAGKLITPSIINNYVKLGIIPQPVKKKYSRTHIAYLMMICLLKQALPILAITDLIAYQLQSEDIMVVYDRFCRLQEQSTKVAVETARTEYFSTTEQDDANNRSLIELTLKMAATANSSKFFAEKVITLKREEETNRSTEEISDEEKKSKAK